MNKHVCKCGTVISDDVINQITLNGKYPHFANNVACSSCIENGTQTVERVAGVMPTDHKMKGNLVVCSQEEAARYIALSRRAGTGVSQGVKFHNHGK